MNKILLGTFGLLPLSASLYAQSAENQPDKRPNIIFFLVDDMDGRILPCLSGQRRHPITGSMKLPTWNVWPVRE